MTVIRPNSVSGINSITAQANEIKIFKSDGTQGGLMIDGANLNATSGISTVAALTVTGNVSVGGTLTYQDVTNIDSVGIITARAGVKVPDNQKVFLGTDSDLEIYHDGSNARIKNTTGQLWLQSDNGIRFVDSDVNESTARFTDNGAVELYYDGVKKFETTSYGAQFTDNVKFDNPDTAGRDLTWEADNDALHWEDNTKATFGAGNDLQIYHNGTHSYIADEGSGELNISGSRIQLMNAARSEKAIDFVQDGAVDIYYDGSRKFQTTSSGVEISGGLHSQRLIITDNGATSPLASIRADDQSPWALTIGNDSYSTSDRGMSFYQSNAGDGYMRMRGDGAWENFYIQTNDGTTTNTALHIDTSRAVHLKYQNNTKFSTKSDGVDITGELSSDLLKVYSGNTGTVDIADFYASNNGSGGTNCRLKVRTYPNAGGDPFIFFDGGGTNFVVGEQWNGTTNNKLRLGAGNDMGTVSGIDITSAGHVLPTSNGALDLGSSSLRYRSVHATSFMANGGASVLATNANIDPDAYPNTVVAGSIADGTGWSATGIGGNMGTGDSWAIAHNGGGLYYGLQNGSSANSMQTYLYVDSTKTQFESKPVLKPQQPGVYLDALDWSSNTPYMHNGYQFWNVGNHWNNSTGTFTCPVAGKYLVAADAQAHSAVTGNYANIIPRKNNSNYGLESVATVASGGSGHHASISFTIIMDCAANDTIRVYSNHSFRNNTQNKLTIYLLG